MLKINPQLCFCTIYCIFKIYIFNYPAEEAYCKICESFFFNYILYRNITVDSFLICRQSYLSSQSLVAAKGCVTSYNTRESEGLTNCTGEEIITRPHGSNNHIVNYSCKVFK